MCLRVGFQRSIRKIFPQYTVGADINKAAKYILWRFMQANRARLSIYLRLTQAADMTKRRLVFAAMQETILQNAWKNSGMLSGIPVGSLRLLVVIVFVISVSITYASHPRLLPCIRKQLQYPQ